MIEENEQSHDAADGAVGSSDNQLSQLDKAYVETKSGADAGSESDTVSDQDSPTAVHSKELSLLDQLKVLFGASRAFWLVNLVSFGDGIAYFGILTLLTRFLGAELQMTDAMAGIAVSTFTGLVTLFMFGGGYVSDWLGVRRALLASLLVIGVGRCLLAVCPELPGGGLYMAWIAIFLMALGAGVLEPAMYAGVKEFTDPRTAAIGYSLLYSIMNLGIVGANFVSPYVRSEEVFLSFGNLQIRGLGLGIQGVFAVCAAITVLIMLAQVFFFTKKVEAHDRYRADGSQDQGDGSEAAPSQKINPFANLKFVFFIFILLPVRTLFAHQWLTLPDYVFRCYPPEVAAKFEWISGLNPLIIVVFVPLVAMYTRKMRVIDMMLIGTTVSALTTFILVPGPELHRLLLYVTLFSFGEALWSSRFLEYVADLAPAGQVGAYMGLAGMPWFLAKFTTGLYSGSMLEWFVPEKGVANSETLWLIYALIALITPIGLLLARKWLIADEKR